MEDDYLSGGDNSNEDITLPKATVTKLIQEMLPADVVCSRESRDLLIECCVEFIHLLSSEANDLCEKERKKTISPEHVLQALESLGFGQYVGEVQQVYSEHRSQMKEREKKNSKLEDSGLTEEELLRQQEALFEQARLKYLAQNVQPPSPSPSPSSS